MEWIEIVRKNDIALLQSESDTQYVVVSGYNPALPENQQWNSGIYYTYHKSDKVTMLSSALETFRERTEENYISRIRIIELADKFKDGLLADDYESAMEYFESICEMTDEEKVLFDLTRRE